MSTRLLETRDLVAGYGRLEILHGVSLYVDPGEVVALVGPNGAGKTTFARAVSGLLPVRRGTVKVRGRDVENSRPHEIVKFGLAHVPEGRELFSELTVLENLDAGALSRSDRDGILADKRRILDLFPVLVERLGERARLLSGGEQQMLAIARALMAKPHLLVLDEPTQGLAPRVIADVRDLVGRLASERYGVLLVEQNSAVVRDVSSRAVLLESGNVTAEGATAEVLGSAEFQRAYLGVDVAPESATEQTFDRSPTQPS